MSSGYTNAYGMSLYVKEGRAVFHYNLFGNHYLVGSELVVPVGHSILGVRFERVNEGAQATVLINDEPAVMVHIFGIIRTGRVKELFLVTPIVSSCSRVSKGDPLLILYPAV